MTRLSPHGEPAAAPAANAPVSKAECRQLVDNLLRVMDSLLSTVEQETELVREGKLTEATALVAEKSELASRYLADTTRLKANAAAISEALPQTLAQLQQHHDLFRALLQINLAVLATAHAVSEGIIRSAAGEVARKAAPQTYGASGRPVAAPRHATQPVAVSRTL
jgi:hypothetical protein